MRTFERYGTVAFERDFILSLIGFGDLVENADGSISIESPGSTLQLGVWLAAVPEVYRDKATDIAWRVTRNLRGQKATQQMLHRIATEIHAKLMELEPVSPLETGLFHARKHSPEDKT